MHGFTNAASWFFPARFSTCLAPPDGVFRSSCSDPVAIHRPVFHRDNGEAAVFANAC